MTATLHRCWVYGDDVNTDVIFPGKYTYTLTEPAELAAHALEDLDPAFAREVRPGDVIVAGRNWGCGSSREQAVSALKAAGVSVIIAASFSRIYVRTGDTIQIDRAAGQIAAAGRTFAIPPLSPSVQAILDAGGLIPMLRARFAGERAP